MRIGPAANVARINVDEIITAFWTIGGVGLRNTAIDLLGLGSPANRILGSGVVGDADERFRLHAGGIMQWGDGTGARDTQLQRDAANELGTPDDFNVGGVLDLGGDIELSERSFGLAAGLNHNVVTGANTMSRLAAAAGGSDITGFAGGRLGRLLMVVNTAVSDVFTLRPQNTGSIAANRIITPVLQNIIIAAGEGATLWYDDTTQRWRVVHYVT